VSVAGNNLPLVTDSNDHPELAASGYFRVDSVTAVDLADPAFFWQKLRWSEWKSQFTGSHNKPESGHDQKPHPDRFVRVGQDEFWEGRFCPPIPAAKSLLGNNGPSNQKSTTVASPNTSSTAARNPRPLS